MAAAMPECSRTAITLHSLAMAYDLLAGPSGRAAGCFSGSPVLWPTSKASCYWLYLTYLLAVANKPRLGWLARMRYALGQWLLSGVSLSPMGLIKHSARARLPFFIPFF